MYVSLMHLLKSLCASERDVGVFPKCRIGMVIRHVSSMARDFDKNGIVICPCHLFNSQLIYSFLSIHKILFEVSSFPSANKRDVRKFPYYRANTAPRWLFESSANNVPFALWFIVFFWIIIMTMAGDICNAHDGDVQFYFQRATGWTCRCGNIFG